MILGHSALSGQRALLIAAVLVSWCALPFGTNTAPAQSVPPYPKGIWTSVGVDDDVPPEVVNNLGIVGVGVAEDWSVVNPAPGVYDWTQLDSRLAKAKAAGFQYISIAVTDSSDKTPQWLLDSLPEDQKVALLDTADQHKTFCQPILTALYWNPVFHQARLNLIAAFGARYTSDPAIVATNAATFANHHSNDWNIQDWIGTVQCPSCPQPPPTECGEVFVDEVQQWMDAGWTEQQMLQVGKEICDAAAAAFPNQNIKLPIGGLTDDRMSTPDGDPANGNYSQLARDIENYVYGNAALGIPPQPYANRFYMQRNVVTATWKNGDYYDTYTPPFQAEGYIKYMIRNHAKPAEVGGLTPGRAGLQMVAAAMLGSTDGCKLGGGANSPCGPTCDPGCVLQTALDVARTYNTDFIEIFAQDAQEPAFYSMITAATLAMGGTPRGGPTPTPTPTVTPTPTPTPSATPTPTSTPSPTPNPKRLRNLSTRVQVSGGDSVMIGGFIILGDTSKDVVIRALGPSLTALGVQHALADPELELYDSMGTLVEQNDNWTSLPPGTVPVELEPTNPLEAVIAQTLSPGTYTAVLRGTDASSGNALCELFDLDQTDGSSLRNISTRGEVGTGDGVMIGGFILGGTDPTKLMIRAIGPSLTEANVPGALPDPMLELHDSKGSLILQNDNWRSTQEQQIIDSTLPPANDRESAIIATLPPGAYTAVVRDAGGLTGVGLVEVYSLDP